ncbi:unnamed protein product [Peniophora sp. CBMAI 1063]|nr:unnamed protein product [Peniophora sp. CBMAI 1063]
MLILVIKPAQAALILCRQRRDIDRFLQSDDSSISRINYHRLFILASLNILLTLPLTIATVVLSLFGAQIGNSARVVFYSGWTVAHSTWEPQSYPYADLDVATVAYQYFKRWSTPSLAIVHFSLFGLTAEARASYVRVIHTIGR